MPRPETGWVRGMPSHPYVNGYWEQGSLIDEAELPEEVEVWGIEHAIATGHVRMEKVV